MNRAQQHPAHELGLADRPVPAGVLDICKTLQGAAYEAYLVGGCIRDWIMGKTPKDFDIATDATPEQVKRLFKRSRIIGRRFKIVHVYTNYRELVEVTTYRASPESSQSESDHIHRQNEKGRLLRDNVYGTIEDDAYRRDFSVNALYYDPIKQSVLDFTDGLSAIQSNQLRVIGDAEQRFAEDPVRMLRALRFIAKLDFTVSESLSKLIRKDAPLLRDVSNARLYDETFKLFHHAHGVKSWAVLEEYGLIDILFPLTARYLQPDSAGQSTVSQFIYAALENTDRRVGQSKPVIPAFFFAVILWHAYCDQRAQAQNLPKGREGAILITDEIMRAQYPRIAVPKRVSMVVMEIWDMQQSLEKRWPKQINKLLESKRFRAAYDFLLLRQKIDEVPASLTQWWTKIQEADATQRSEMIDNLPAAPKNKRPRRRRFSKNKPHKAPANTPKS